MPQGITYQNLMCMSRFMFKHVLSCHGIKLKYTRLSCKLNPEKNITHKNNILLHISTLLDRVLRRWYILTIRRKETRR